MPCSCAHQTHSSHMFVKNKYVFLNNDRFYMYRNNVSSFLLSRLAGNIFVQNFLLNSPIEAATKNQASQKTIQKYFHLKSYLHVRMFSAAFYCNVASLSLSSNICKQQIYCNSSIHGGAVWGLANRNYVCDQIQIQFLHHCPPQEKPRKGGVPKVVIQLPQNSLQGNAQIFGMSSI